MNEEYTTKVLRSGYKVYKERKEKKKHQTYEKGIAGGKHVQCNEDYKLGFTRPLKLGIEILHSQLGKKVLEGGRT